MLTGILKPNAGSIVFDGHDITDLPVHKRIRLGLSRSFQILSVFPNLTAFENVRVAVQAQDSRSWGLWRDAYGYDDLNARTWSLLAAVGLEDRAAEPCANLGHGQRRLLEIAISLATDAKLLLLDEPLAGLAEADRQVVGALIRKLADTHAVLLIEHDIDRVLALSDRITVLHQGRLIADGKPAEVGSNPDVVTAYLGAERIVPPPAPTDADRAAHAASAAAAGGGQTARRLCRQRGAGGSFAGRPRRRGGRAAGPQRRRQDDDAARDHRHGRAAARPDHAGRQRDHQRPAVRDQPEGHLPGARGSPAVSQPDGAGQSAPGDAAGRRVARRRVRAVPEAEAAAALQGRKPVGRRAPDAGDRPRADGARAS